MPPRIAIPVPTSFDPEYNDRSWPQYAQAVERAGGTPVAIPLHDPPAATAKLIASCTGVLLPGSGADVNPQKYGEPLHPAAAPPDPARENVDELLLQDAHNMGKPLLAICFGTQMLNVWRGGSLIQDLPHEPVLHKAGRTIAEAHTVDIAPHSLLATLLAESTAPPDQSSESPTQNLSFGPEREARSGETCISPRAIPRRPHPNPVISTGAQRSGETCISAPAQTTGLTHEFLQAAVNSSHHQAIASPGDGLFIAARSTQDGVIEAIEGGHGHGAPDWDRAFLLGIQWHPERTYDQSPLSRAIFHRLIHEAATWTPRPVTTSVA